jgi:hypothetical protein
MPRVLFGRVQSELSLLRSRPPPSSLHHPQTQLRFLATSLSFRLYAHLPPCHKYQLTFLTTGGSQELAKRKPSLTAGVTLPPSDSEDVKDVFQR